MAELTDLQRAGIKWMRAHLHSPSEIVAQWYGVTAAEVDEIATPEAIALHEARVRAVGRALLCRDE